MLKKIIDNDWIELKSVIGIWSACSDGDDILLKNSDNSHLETFCMLRQQTLKSKKQSVFIRLHCAKRVWKK